MKSDSVSATAEQQATLAALDFPTPAAANGGMYRPLYSGLWVPGGEQDTTPLPPVATDTAPAAESAAAAGGFQFPVPALPSAAPASAPEATSAAWSGCSRVAHALADRLRRPQQHEAARVQGWTLLPLAVLMLAAAAAAFVLSFEMMLPVVVAAGWALAPWLGPVLIDLAAVGAAFMHVASRHAVFVRTGRFLLVVATSLSIVFNLAGHAMKLEAPAAAALPGHWHWVVWLFAVAVPVILAVLIHAFGKALMAWSAQQPPAGPATAANQPPAGAAPGSENQPSTPGPSPSAAKPTAAAKPATAKRTATKPTTSSAPDSRGGGGVQRGEALAVGRAAGAVTPARLRDALAEAGWKPPPESTIKRWSRELRDEEQV